MGGTTFDQLVPGTSVRAAYDTAVDEAIHEYGHGGYSGTIKEKSGYNVITHEVMTPAQATTLAYDLIEKSDPRIDDKWGPAGAIPVYQGIRHVDVSGITYTHPLGFEKAQEANAALIEAAKTKVKLKKGETIRRVSLTSYTQPSRNNLSYHRPVAETRTNCSMRVEIAAPPVERTEKITVKISGGNDHQKREEEARTEVEKKVRLKAGESIVTTRIASSTPAPAKAVAVPTTGKTETRFILKNAHRILTPWNEGLPSQAKARARAVELAGRDGGPFESGDEVYEVEGVTRRADGQPLVRIERRIPHYTVEVEVTIALPRKTPLEVDAWLFFGWAST